MATSRKFAYQRSIEGEAPFRPRTTAQAMIDVYGNAMLDGFVQANPQADRSKLSLDLDEPDDKYESIGFIVLENDVPVSSMTERGFLLYALESFYA